MKFRTRTAACGLCPETGGCQQETSGHSHDAVGFFRFLVRLIASWWEIIISQVPLGYEDATGFHHGVPAANLPAIRTGCLANRPAVKTRLQARWKAVQATQLFSGGQLVLQWDSSSRLLPNCRPKPFLTKSSPHGCSSLFKGAPRSVRQYGFSAKRWI